MLHLNKELIPPAVKGFEGVGGGHVVGEDAAVRPAVEGDSKGLEPEIQYMQHGIIIIVKLRVIPQLSSQNSERTLRIGSVYRISQW